MMKKKTLLVIGDERINRKAVNRSFLRFVRYAHRLQDRGLIQIKVVSYTQLLAGRVPSIDTPLIKTVLFFPYQYWNRNIENYQDGRIYGDKKFGWEFKTFLRKVKQAIERYYLGKTIEYLNPPENCYLDRDKKAGKNLLSKNAVPTPHTFRAFNFSDIEKLLKKGKSLYVKPRFGAMGKGITYVDKEKTSSNFFFRKDKVVSKPYDYNWPFIRIREKEKFLNALLKKGFVCEEAIEPPTFRNRRFDFRIYVMFGKVVYLYAKSAPAEDYVTNWSQGGRVDKNKVILRNLPGSKIEMLERLAKRATSTLGLNFAGIDVIFSKDLKSAYVLEANAFPGFEKGFDLMKCLLKYLVK